MRGTLESVLTQNLENTYRKGRLVKGLLNTKHNTHTHTHKRKQEKQVDSREPNKIAIRPIWQGLRSQWESRFFPGEAYIEIDVPQVLLSSPGCNLRAPWSCSETSGQQALASRIESKGSVFKCEWSPISVIWWSFQVYTMAYFKKDWEDLFSGWFCFVLFF